MTKFKRPEFLFVLITLWLTLEFFILGPYSYVRVFDVGNLHIPQNIITSRNFWQGFSNYWYPYTMSGIDLMAEGYRATNLLYMSLPYYLLPAWLAYPFFLFGTVFVGGYFTYRLGRDHLGLSEESSFFAGISVACVLGFWANCLISILALVLFFLNKIYEKSRSSTISILWIVPLSLLFASSSCLVFDHIVLVVIPAWFLFILRKKGLRFWFFYFVFVSIAFTYHLPTLWAQFANASYSHRANITVHLWNQFSQIIGYMFFIHDYRSGHFVFPILWSLGIVWAIWKLRFQSKPFNGMLGLFVLLVGSAFFLNTAAYFFADSIGFFKGVRFNYTLESLPLLYALAGAFALETFLPLSRRSLWLLFVVLFLCTLYPKLWNGNRWLHGDHYANLFDKNVFKQIAGSLDKNHLFRVGSVSWGIFHPAVEAYGLEAVDGYVHLYPKRYEHFFAAILERDGNSSVGNRAQLISNQYNWNLLSLANVEYLLSDGNNDLFTEGYLQQNGLVLFHSPQDGNGREFLKNFRSRDNLAVFKNKNVLPRFFVAKTPLFFENGNDLLQAMKKVETAETFREVVYLEKKDANIFPLHRENFKFANIEIIEYTPDKIRLSLTMDGSGILVVSNSYSPYWRAFIDGKEHKIIPANYAFWGIPVSSENHDIVFVYDPPYRIF